MITKIDSTPNTRLKCKFYVLSSTVLTDPTVDTLGQLEREFGLHSSGYFSKSKSTRPREIREGDRTVNEYEEVLRGTWTKTLSNVTHGMYCFIPSYSKLYAVSCDAIDMYGDRRYIHIYIVGNVTQDIRQLMPGAEL